MKKILIIFYLISTASICISQETIYSSITHDELQREYILYVPEIYNENTVVPLVINFHGYTSDAESQMNYGDFRSIADTAGFLVVHPQGTLLNGLSHWNVGGWTAASTVDDVGFTDALIDSLSSEYNIEQDRVYSTGMSNGGFMSFLLACQLGNRIAAIASVSGSMTTETYNESNPQHPTPIMQIHGTADFVVPYNGFLWSEPINDVIEYWVTYNNCYPIPSVTNIANIDPNDGSTVEHVVYDEGDNGVTVEHFLITGGGHTWPGNVNGGAGTNNDINASQEIWNFFNRYDMNGLIIPVGVEDANVINQPDLQLRQNHPNPFNPSTQIKFVLSKANQVKLEIYNIKGEKIKTLVDGFLPAAEYTEIWDGKDDDQNKVSSGCYFYKMKAGKYTYTKKMILLK